MPRTLAQFLFCCERRPEHIFTQNHPATFLNIVLMPVAITCMRRSMLPAGGFTPGLRHPFLGVARIYLNSPICQVTSRDYYRYYSINELAATSTAIVVPVPAALCNESVF
jgi:hypothetical protein